MATIKSYSDLEQSKKLAEILPLESADTLHCIDFDGYLLFTTPKQYSGSFRYQPELIIPCWSLASLLNVLPTLDGRNAVLCQDIRYDEWHICYHSTAILSVIDTERYNNPVDACYEMILKLHELKML